MSDYEWQDGTNGPDYIITAAGIYSVTLNDGCSEVSDVIEVMALAPPAPFDLGDNQNLCQGDELNILFDPLLGDFNWQDQSTSSTYTISTGGTYSLTISNMCGMETDEIIITSLDIPDVSLGLDNQIMCAWEIIDLELDPSWEIFYGRTEVMDQTSKLPNPEYILPTFQMNAVLEVIRSMLHL